MGARYECKLESHLLERAQKELNEPLNNDLRLEAIDKLRTKFEREQDELHLLRSDDIFLLRFLRAKKFDQDKAFAALLNYHRTRKELPEVYDKIHNKVSIARIFGSGALGAIRQKANDGSTVTIYRPGLVPEDITFSEQIGAFLVFLERLLEEEDVQICGTTSITDFTAAGISLVKQCTPYNMKCLFAVTTLNLHGENFTKLHEIVDPKGLPPFLAGTGPDIDSNYWKSESLSTLGHGELTGF